MPVDLPKNCMAPTMHFIFLPLQEEGVLYSFMHYYKGYAENFIPRTKKKIGNFYCHIRKAFNIVSTESQHVFKSIRASLLTVSLEKLCECSKSLCSHRTCPTATSFWCG